MDTIYVAACPRIWDKWTSAIEPDGDNQMTFALFIAAFTIPELLVWIASR